jgi:hypothetical protein
MVRFRVGVTVGVRVGVKVKVRVGVRIGVDVGVRARDRIRRSAQSRVGCCAFNCQALRSDSMHWNTIPTLPF